MINKLVDISEKTADEKKRDPDLLERMEVAAKGQSPRFLILSPIDRSAQDLQLLDLRMGDAFHATRVPWRVLPAPENSPVLFAGPACYNRNFPENSGVIVTFEEEESSDVISESLSNLSKHPDLEGIPVLALRVDYDKGLVGFESHGFDRNPDAERWVSSRIQRPDGVDRDYLVLICSDSRVQPPRTPKGHPMAIQTLGGYIPRHSDGCVETSQLDDFFQDWLSRDRAQRKILIVMHGSFKGVGAPCGAAHASLNPASVDCRVLRPLVEQISNHAACFEEQPAENAEDRVVALASAIKENLLSYPTISSCFEERADDFIGTAFMNTVTNVLSVLEH
jgi:hypothetical protein